jgi:hypothetical protein
MFFSTETMDGLEAIPTRLRVAALFVRDKEREDLAKVQISVSASQLLTLLRDDRPKRRNRSSIGTRMIGYPLAKNRSRMSRG